MAGKFKVGDRVKVKRERWYHSAYVGEIGTIVDANPFGIYVVKLAKSNKYGEQQLIREEDLELYNPVYKNDDNNWKIVIIPQGDKTSARLYENNVLVNSVTVENDYKDTYDKFVAADESIKKLFGKQKEPEPEKMPFNVGDIVEVTDKYMHCPAGLRGVCVVCNDHEALIDFKIPYAFTHCGAGDRLYAPTGYYIDTKCLKKVSEQK